MAKTLNNNVVDDHEMNEILSKKYNQLYKKIFYDIYPQKAIFLKKHLTNRMVYPQLLDFCQSL